MCYKLLAVERNVFSGTLLVSLLLGIVTSAAAANPCKQACRSTKSGCAASATAAFTNAKTACRANPAEKRTCLQRARADKAAAKAACKQAFKSCAAGCGGGGPGPSGNCNASAAGGWLQAVNLYRAVAGLTPVAEDPALSDGDRKHAQYVVRNDELSHSEDPAKPGYTPEGAAAGSRSNVAAATSATLSETAPIDLWMRGPYHAIGILDPTLATVGFGIAHDDTGGIQSAAALDVLSGRSASNSTATYPILFPGDGSQVPIDRYDGTERPDPLAQCPGYAAPTGLPLIVQLADGVTPTVTSSSFTRDGASVEHCVFAGSPGDSLGNRRAVVLIGREVLRKGSTYQASITVGGQTITWSFALACQ